MELLNSIINLQNLLVCIVAVLPVHLIYLNSRRRRGLPPGPIALPLVGNMFDLGKDVRGPLLTLSKRYGDVISVYIGPTLAVFLNSYESIKDAFVTNGHNFNYRPYFFFQIIWKERGIATSDGELWKEHKKFLLQTFTNIGMKKRLFQDSIEQEVTALVTLLKSHNGTPVQPMDIFIQSTCNIVCAFLWGKRYEYNDVRFQKKMQYMRESFELVGATELLNIFPSLKHIPGDIFKYKKFIRNCKEHIALEAEDIESHNESRDRDNPRGYVDVYLNAKEDQNNDSENLFTEDQLHVTILDLFGTGSQSSAATLVWALYYMLHYPDVLAKVREEIANVVGSRKSPELLDRTNLPYTEATLLEIQRLCDVAPLGIPHGTKHDVTFRGYTIPKGSMVFSNLNAVNMDPELWKNPNNFKPERFLQKQNDGKLSIVKTEYFIPFSVGKRSCPGESLARMELVHFFSTIVHLFDISLPDDTPLPCLKGKMSTLNMPPEVKLIMKIHTHTIEE